MQTNIKNIKAGIKIEIKLLHVYNSLEQKTPCLRRILGTDSTPADTLIKDIINPTVHETHAPHPGLGRVWVLGQPVVHVGYVVRTGSPSQTLDKGRDVERLQARSRGG